MNSENKAPVSSRATLPPLASFQAGWTLARLRLADELKHSRLMRTANSLRLLASAQLASGPARADKLTRALAFSESAALDQRIIRNLTSYLRPAQPALWNEVVRLLPRYRELIRQKPHLNRSIILKAPGPKKEKGVLLMYFEYNWVRLALGLSKTDFQWLDAHFDLILSTSWSPTDYASIALVLSKCAGPVFVQPCNYGETEKLQQFDPRIVVLPTLPCDWINPQFYETHETTERPIDILMVANWGEFKRHWDFFRALRDLPDTLKIVLVGQAEGGRNGAFIQRLASQLGVPQALEIQESVPPAQVSVLQTRAKVSLIFSRREGCCVASVESLFAGCALGMRADAHVGPLAYIHAETGRRLRPRHLAEDIATLLRDAPSLKPAEWAKKNISCHQTHAKVNAALRDSALQRGLPWSTDLALPHWRPYPRHVRPEDMEKLRPAYAECHRRFPHTFAPDLIETSHR